MNMEPDKELTDEQLDAMLRNVQVPSELKSRLKQIPKSVTLREEGVVPLASKLPTSPPLPQTSWLSYALVAGLLGVAAFAAAKFLPSAPNNVKPGQVASTNSNHVEGNPNSNLLEPTPAQLSALDGELQILEAEIQTLESARLESELLQLETRSNQRLSDNEVESMILALAPQYSIPLGGKEADVRSEMARVIRDYPNTRGAVLAVQILKQIN